jgi:predicted RNA-binding protein YlqC (UPF0109 family)
MPRHLSGGSVNFEAFLKEILDSAVEHPEQLRVEVAVNGRKQDVIIHAVPSDRGRIIGRNGRLISSLRTMCKLAGEKAGLIVNLEVFDEDGKDHSRETQQC